MKLRIILFGLVGLTLFLAVYPYPIIATFGLSIVPTILQFACSRGSMPSC